MTDKEKFSNKVASPFKIRQRVAVALKDLLKEKRKAILKKWYNLVLDTYPPEAAAFFRKNRDRFENPVGAKIHEGIEGLLDQLLSGPDPEKVNFFVDQIIRVRAVQDFTPADAVKVIFLLKKAIKDVLKDELTEDILKEFLLLEEEIDSFALKAFDIYMGCRERLYHLKVEEWKSKLYMLLRKANLIYDTREGVLIEKQT